MTAEIAILNKSAVALAADSKVTLGISDRSKTYDTVNKLFTLSKSEPVGAMVFGNAEFMEFPWETVIKKYRCDEEGYYFPKLENYADDLIEYLPTFFNFQPEDSRENVAGILQSEFGEIDRMVRTRMSAPGTPLTEEEAKTKFKEVVYEYADYFSKLPNWKPRRRITVERIRSIYGDIIEDTIKKWFRDWPTPAQKKKLINLSVDIIRKDFQSQRSSGLVVSGFGESELFPTLVAYKLDGLIDGQLKYQQTHKYDLSRKELGVIVPFAQSDMMHRFMEGVDPEYHDFSTGMLRTLFQDGAKEIVDQYVTGSDRKKALIKKKIEKETTGAFQSAMDNLSRYREQMFVDNIMETVVMLPKEELAHLAESLVNLTSLQRRVSLDVESVGGPVDVAVISKGDGFIWLKRKHYFEPRLNPHYFETYYKR